MSSAVFLRVKIAFLEGVPAPVPGPVPVPGDSPSAAGVLAASVAAVTARLPWWMADLMDLRSCGLKMRSL